LTTSYLCILNH